MHHVRLFLNVPEVLCLRTLVLQAFFVRVEDDVTLHRCHVVGYIHGLGNIIKRLVSLDSACHFNDGLLSHTVDNQIGRGITENAGAQLVLPVVVVGQPAQGGFDASQDDGNVGIELAKYLGIDDGGIFRPHVVPAVRTVGIFRAQAAVGGILVDHRVHASRSNAEEETRTPQLLEVPVVAVPVGLWDDGHAIACCFQCSSDDGSPERGMVNIGIARE